jgi:hypothetical protein
VHYNENEERRQAGGDAGSEYGPAQGQPEGCDRFIADEDAIDTWLLDSSTPGLASSPSTSSTRLQHESLSNAYQNLAGVLEVFEQVVPSRIESIDNVTQGYQFAPESVDSQDEHNQASENILNLSMVLTKPSHIPTQPSFVSGGGDRVVQKLVSHYFDAICRALSCFDSSNNPLRAYIPIASHQTTHVYNCMLGVAAAHMANFDEQMGVAAFEYQGRTIRSLQQQIDELPKRSSSSSAASNSLTMVATRKSRLHILLTTILLGVTAVSLACAPQHRNQKRLLIAAELVRPVCE